MRYCFDIDGVIFEISKNYQEYIPIKKTIKFINELKLKNYTIILYTARKMKTYKGNIGVVNKNIVEETLKQLRVNNVEYDEIFFGKPAADYYIDDKAINFYDMELITMNEKNENSAGINMGVLNYRLNEIEKSLDKNMEQILTKIDRLIEQHNQSEVNQKALKVKVERLEDEVKELKEVDKKVQEDVNNVKVSLAEKMGYGMAGGGLITVLTKVLETFGGG
jgi:capsule biosynthesis phosphatase